MEPDVIRMYSSSPPPLTDDCSADLDEDGVDDFGDFDTYCGVPASVSFSELATPTTFNQTEALGATSPPELLLAGFGRTPPSNGTHTDDTHELLRANGVVPAGHLGSSPSERTEVKKVISSGPDILASGGGELADCNGDNTPALTNGFSTFDSQESPSPQNCVHSDLKGAPPSGEDGTNAPQDDFADFAAFAPDADSACSQTPGGATELKEGEGEKEELPQVTASEQLRDQVRTSVSSDKEPEASEEFCTNGPAAINGLDGSEDSEEAGPWDGKENDTETETETSLGRPLSTEALEELGDISATTGSAPLGGDAATPAEHSQLVEDEDEGAEDFGDFGDPASFTDFQQPDMDPSGGSPPSSGSAHQTQDEDDFGDFNSPEFDQVGRGGAGGEAEFSDFPPSDSFGNFSSAADDGGGWSAFGGEEAGLEEREAEEGESWAAFSSEQSLAPPAVSTEQQEKEEDEEWHRTETGRTEAPLQASLSSRLENLFQVSFPQTGIPQRLEDTVVSLKSLLGGAEPQQQQEGNQEQQEIRPSTGRSITTSSSSVWLQLQDIHEALGLRYQWGGSHCNKVLLCSLGIDTRNILFTGQKKQPVIVPMYAASLGMLEPTKEPVKPVSAAEMIASIAQTPPAASEQSSCPSDTVQQEALPPIQFDWSSSGLTNPLDASGGSSLLNLDFFGPVEDSGSSSSASIPGVDPELYELTTAKLDASAPSSRVADAFARLMSTMDKTSTATRKPKKEEHLSEEAAKVMASLPDLSFMQAKVLMFPATLTPLSSQATPD